MLKKLLLSAGFLMVMIVPTTAKAEYGYSMPSYGGYSSSPSYSGYSMPYSGGYSSYPSYGGSYGYSQPSGYRYSIGVSIRYTPYQPNYGFNACGMSYGGCNNSGGYGFGGGFGFGSHGMGGGFGMGMGYGQGYGGRHMSCGNRHHGHRSHRCGSKRRCCGKRRFRFALNIGFGAFRLGIRSARW